jgi:hypothetical protein
MLKIPEQADQHLYLKVDCPKAGIAESPGMCRAARPGAG